jgi:hypothetical protein
MTISPGLLAISAFHAPVWISDMEPPKVKRRRRRRSSRSSRIGRETFQWFSLIVLGIKKTYHWVMLLLIIVFILMVGFAYPAFA